MAGRGVIGGGDVAEGGMRSREGLCGGGAYMAGGPPGQNDRRV